MAISGFGNNNNWNNYNNKNVNINKNVNANNKPTVNSNLNVNQLGSVKSDGFVKIVKDDALISGNTNQTPTVKQMSVGSWFQNAWNKVKDFIIDWGIANTQDPRGIHPDTIRDVSSTSLGLVINDRIRGNRGDGR